MFTRLMAMAITAGLSECRSCMYETLPAQSADELPLPPCVDDMSALLLSLLAPQAVTALGVPLASAWVKPFPAIRLRR